MSFAARAAIRAAVFAVAAAASAAEPERPRSHEDALASLSQAEGDAFRALLAEYDAYLAERPDDVAVQVDRCRFLASASCDEDGECPYWDQHEACVAALEQRFAGAAEADLYRLEQRWGEPAIELGTALIEGGARRWDLAEVARVHLKLARSYGVGEDAAKVLAHAQSAMQLDDSLDVTLLAAQALDATGRRAAAIEMLNSREVDEEQRWSELQKISLLEKLGAYRDAALRLDRLGPRDAPAGEDELADVPFDGSDPLVAARVFAQVGRVDEARAELDRAQASPSGEFRAREIARERFELELLHGDAAAAAAAYDALREEEWDPIFRERLRLAVHHPDAPWRAEDSWGLLGAFGLVLATGLAVGALLVPAHYVGLLRARRRPGQVPAATRFRLRHCWYVLCLLIVSSFPLFYLDGFRWFDDLRGVGEQDLYVYAQAAELEEKPIPDVTLAQASVLGVGLSLLGLVPLLSRRDLALFGTGRWTLVRTLIVSALLLFSLRVVTWLWILAGAGAESGGPPDVAATSYTTQTLLALGRSYGMPVLALVVIAGVPLFEEVAFRGVLLQGVSRHLPPWIANFSQASLFAVAHEDWTHLPVLFLMAITTGSVARRSGSLLGPLLIHAGFNALAVYYAGKLLAAG